MVGLAGFEPATSPLSGVRSNQLSYRPEEQNIIDFLILKSIFKIYYSSEKCITSFASNLSMSFSPIAGAVVYMPPGKSGQS